MLGILLAATYAFCTAATWFFFMQPVAIIETPFQRVRWIVVVTIGSALWPVTWSAVGMVAWWAKNEWKS